MFGADIGGPTDQSAGSSGGWVQNAAGSCMILPGGYPVSVSEDACPWRGEVRLSIRP